MSIKDTIQQYTQLFSDRIDRMNVMLDTFRGPKGYVLVGTGNQDTPVEARSMVQYNPVLVNTNNEAQFFLGEEESFENVFNTWRRISHNGTRFPARENELNAWVYNAEKDTITCTVNSASLIGFISPDRHDHYVFEVRMSSTHHDNDSIGVCLAYTLVDGQEHALIAMRTPGGSQGHGGTSVRHRAKLLDVVADIFNPQARYTVGSTNGGLKWGDGIVDDERVPSSDLTQTRWNNEPRGCLLRITREGDQFTVETTNMGSDEYVPTATVRFSLNDHSRLAKFKGPQRYGYVCYSQPNSSWETLKKPVSTNQVICLEEAQSYEWDGQTFQLTSTQSLVDDLQPGLFYYNQTLQRTHYKVASGQLIAL